MIKAIRVHANGGPEVLRYEEIELPPPGHDEVHIRQHAIGLNYIDIYHRTGLYPNPLPFTPGTEGAGEVLAWGKDVIGFQKGDRVAYASTIGGYAEERNVKAAHLLKIPSSVSYETGAAMMLKGLTAQYLLRRTFQVGPGHIVLFHAAAGGVGLIACQWAKYLGAHVIGTVGSASKAELAKANGCDDVILYRTENFAERVKEITNGRLCDVVYDGIGKDTFPASLDCLKPFGMFASFGNASGPVPPFDLGLLAQKGSLFATRQTLFTHIADPAIFKVMAQDLLNVVVSGSVNIDIHSRYPLKDATKAHKALETRITTGATILIP